ncbi:MAG: COG3014 family protein [bacterium]
MKKPISLRIPIISVIVVSLPLLLIFACSTSIWVHYPMRLSRAKSYLIEGRDNLAEKELNARLKSAQDRLLFSLEMGMVHYLEQDFQRCIEEWLTAEEMMEKFERRPVVSIREVSEQIGTLAVNDYLITYQGMTYERVLLHLYLALAYMMRSDPEGARIELKKAEQVQKQGFDRWRGKRSDQLKDSPQARQMEEKILNVYNQRYDMTENLSDFSLNPLVYFLSGYLYEADGYPDEALIDYKRLWDMGIRLESLANQMSQLDKPLNPSKGFSKNVPDQKQGNLLIIHQQGLIPSLEELRIPIQTKDTVVLMAIPIYLPASPERMVLRVSAGNNEIITRELVNVYSLAKESLRERIPGIVTRQIARMVVKANASREMSKKGGSLASMISTIYNIVSEKADLRSWLTIPLSIQVGRMRLPPGRHLINLDLIEGAGHNQIEVEIKAGNYHVLDVRSIGSRMVVHAS